MTGDDADPAGSRARRVEALRCPPTARLASIQRDFGRLVVLTDSLGFHGPEGPVPLADERIYPNLLGERLAELTGRPWVVDVWGRAGWGLRELWLGLQKDVHLQQQLLVPADAVVMGIGSADQLSVAVPRWVMMALPYLRPTRLRREIRRRIDHLHPALTRLSGGRMRFTPPSVIAHTYGKSVDAIRLFAGPEIPLVGVLPPDHAAVYYGSMRTYHDDTHEQFRTLAAQKGVRCVDLAALTRHRLGELNPDGTHWSWPIHADVAKAMASILAGQLAQMPGRSHA